MFLLAGFPSRSMESKPATVKGILILLELDVAASNQPVGRATLCGRRDTMLKTLLLVIGLTTVTQAQELVLEFAPAQTKIQFTLDATLHTVHGTFALKRGTIHFNPATSAVSGEVVIDATSGNSDNEGRDHKMHGDVLESAKFPEIIFRPDRVDGKVAAGGSSTVQVHGSFTIHGASHEMTLPVQVEIKNDGWNASTHFDVPFIDWGMKNPSTFVLHVGHEVKIDGSSAGTRSH
jgi:polyisoprenoid-binding protein YceI